MSCLLLDTKRAVAQARAAGTDRLDRDALDEPSCQLSDDHRARPRADPPLGTGKRTKAHNLLLRLERHQPDVLRFARDPRSPNTNDTGAGNRRSRSAPPTASHSAGGVPTSRRVAVEGVGITSDPTCTPAAP